MSNTRYDTIASLGVKDTECTVEVLWDKSARHYILRIFKYTNKSQKEITVSIKCENISEVVNKLSKELCVQLSR